MAGKRALNQIPFDFIEAHFLELCGAAGGLRAQTQISGAHRWSGRHQHAAFDGMIQLADVSRPGAFVAASTRTFTRRVVDDPTRSRSPVSSTRSNFACRLRGTLAISSRNKVLLSASSNRPTRSERASVKAPLT